MAGTYRQGRKVAPRQHREMARQPCHGVRGGCEGMGMAGTHRRGTKECTVSLGECTVSLGERTGR